jgi:serine O-acetyltransferase
MKFRQIDETGSRVPLPENYTDCWELIRSDSFRHSGKRKSALSIIFESFSRTSVAFSIWFRLSQHKGWLYPLTRHKLHKFKKRYGIFIPQRTVIGYGLYIQHCFGIIINPSAVVGNNVNIGQLTTIGANECRAALIGDGVYIGPGCSIVDDVVIGAGVSIGAGAVVTRNIPENVTAAGVPARVIKPSAHPEYIRNRWRNI